MDEQNQGDSEEIRQVAASGKKLLAIKMYRERTGCSLKDAKEAVEDLMDGRSPSQTSPSSDGLDQNLTDEQLDRVLDALNSGGKIQACKLYREYSGKTLKESKELVEKLMSELGIEAGNGCLILLFAILLGSGAACGLT